MVKTPSHLFSALFPLQKLPKHLYRLVFFAKPGFVLFYKVVGNGNILPKLPSFLVMIVKDNRFFTIQFGNGGF